MVHRVGHNNGQSAFQGLWLFRHGASGSLVFCRGHLAGCNWVLNQFQQHWEHSVTEVSSIVTSNLVIALLSVSPHTDPIFDIEKAGQCSKTDVKLLFVECIGFFSMGTPPNCIWHYCVSHMQGHQTSIFFPLQQQYNLINNNPGIKIFGLKYDECCCLLWQDIYMTFNALTNVNNYILFS